MKFFIFNLLTASVLLIGLAACKSSPKEQIVEAYKFRQNAVVCQTRYLADEIGQTYTDNDAVMKDLDTFIRKSPRVSKVTIASVPMSLLPFSISLTEVQRAAPKPIGKYIPRKRFNISEDMVWYRELLRRKDAYWYQSKKNSEMISYVYPVLKELRPDIVLYILKIDFAERDNPILFWDVPRKYYSGELLRQEKQYLKDYFFFKKEAEKRILTAKQAEKFKKARAYYELRFKQVEKIGKQREKKLKQQQKEKDI